MSEQAALEYVDQALAFREAFPDALEALQRGQAGAWLNESEDARLDAFLAAFPPLLANADAVELGSRHHMNARAVWRLLVTGGEVRGHFDRQLVDGVQLDIEKGNNLDRWKRFIAALQAAGYPIPAGLVLDGDADHPYQRFAQRVVDFQREFDLELVCAHSNRYSSLFALESPRYERFMEGWLELLQLAHSFELPASAPGRIRSAWPKFSQQSELHEKWPGWLRRAADDIRGNIDLAVRPDADANEKRWRLGEAQLSHSRMETFLRELSSRKLADISLDQLGLAGIEFAFNNHDKERQ